MSIRRDYSGAPARRLDFESFPENLELARNIQERLTGNKKLDLYRNTTLTRLIIFKNTAEIERYIVGLYNDINWGSKESALSGCIGMASEAFLISLVGAQGYYIGVAPEKNYGVDDSIIIFVKKMGDSIAMNEIDLDLGSSRWSTSTDLIMDILNSLSIISTSTVIDIRGKDQYTDLEEADLEYNLMTGSSLIAAYSLILYECIKNGSYRGQTLKDVKFQAG